MGMYAALRVGRVELDIEVRYCWGWVIGWIFEIY